MIGKFIYKYQWIIILGTIAVCIWSISLFPKLRTEVDFKNFFPKGNQALTDYEVFTATMGSSENMMIIAVKGGRSSVFDSIFLNKINEFETYINTLNESEKTISILTLPRYYLNVFSLPAKGTYISLDNPIRYKRDSLNIFKDFKITQHVISKDSRTVKIIVKLRSGLSFNETDSYISKIDLKAEQLGLGDIYLLGKKVMESEFVKVVNSELKTSLILCLIFIVIILFFLHRSIAGMLVPLVCMVVSLIMLYGYLALFDRPLSIMANLFPTLILIIGISDAMHITSKYAHESMLSSDGVIAINKTLSEIGVTTFINSLTTAIGFLTLLTMEMQTLREFGVDAAVGLMIAWINSVLLLPALMIKFNLAKSFRKPIESKHWEGVLSAIAHFSLNNVKSIVSVIILLVGISVYGVIHVNTNNLMITSLPTNNRLERDFSFFNDTLEGARTYELILKTAQGIRFNDFRVIEDIAKLQDYLANNFGLDEIISPITGFEWHNTISDRKADWKLPQSQEAIDRSFERLIQQDNKLVLNVIDSTGRLGRLSGRIKDKGRLNMENMYKETYAWIRHNLDTSRVKIQLTGPDYMIDIGHQLRIKNMFYSFWLQILAVSLIVALIYKSWQMIIITFIANIIPVLITGGVMGYSGIELRGSTTAIFAIGYVIAVDNTLHLINRFQLEIRKGNSTRTAILNTMTQTGRPLVMTALILFGGFGILMHSSFGDVYMHGFFISILVVTGIITEFLLTPILLNYFYEEKIDQYGIKT
jgi:uncharacterized protein